MSKKPKKVAYEIIGRVQEQGILNHLLRSKKAEFLALYGRRRVGKTFLIRNFFKNSACRFFHCTGIQNGSLKDQLKEFAKQIGETFYHGMIPAFNENWLDAFGVLNKSMELFSTNVDAQHGRTQAGPSCWMVMRKDVLARGQSYPQQMQAIEDLNIRTGAGYEEQSFAIDLTTVVSAHYVVTGERYLGDKTGMEHCSTYGRVAETVFNQYNYPQHSQIIIGRFTEYGDIRPSYVRVGLTVEPWGHDQDTIGVALLRKF